MKQIVTALIFAGIMLPAQAATTPVKPSTVKTTIARQVSTAKKANIEIAQNKSSSSKNTKTGGVFGALGDVFDNPWITIAANVGTVVAATQGEDTLAKYLLATGNIGNIMDVSRDVMNGTVDLNTVIQGGIAAGSIYAITSDSTNATRNMGIVNTIYSAQDMNAAATQILRDQYGVDVNAPTSKMPEAKVNTTQDKTASPGKTATDLLMQPVEAVTSVIDLGKDIANIWSDTSYANMHSQSH